MVGLEPGNYYKTIKYTTYHVHILCLLPRITKRSYFWSTNEPYYDPGWHEGPEMPGPRYFHACESFIFNGKRTMVVAGGTTSNAREVEFLIEGRDAWESGPPLPSSWSYDNPKNADAIVSDYDTLYYINTWQNLFLKLECSQCSAECEWKTLNIQLKTPRINAVVALIPDNLATCRNRTSEE